MYKIETVLLRQVPSAAYLNNLGSPKVVFSTPNGLIIIDLFLSQQTPAHVAVHNTIYEELPRIVSHRNGSVWLISHDIHRLVYAARRRYFSKPNADAALPFFVGKIDARSETLEFAFIGSLVMMLRGPGQCETILSQSPAPKASNPPCSWPVTSMSMRRATDKLVVLQCNETHQLGILDHISKSRSSNERNLYDTGAPSWNSEFFWNLHGGSASVLVIKGVHSDENYADWDFESCSLGAGRIVRRARWIESAGLPKSLSEAA